jgi:hypothetical protein
MNGNNNPGVTKAISLGTPWQQLGTLYNSDYPTELKEGTSIAAGCWLYIDANDAEVCFADSLPSLSKGHVLAAGDSTIWGNAAWIKRAWLRNKTAGSVAVLVVTPTFAF